MNNLSSKLGGLILIAVGIGYIGDQLDIWNFTIFFHGWWALLLAIWGLFNIVQNRPNFFNVIVTALAIYWFMLANHMLGFTITYQLVVAVFLIYLGCKIAFSNFLSSSTKRNFTNDADNKSVNNDGHVVIKSSFSTRRYVNDRKIYSCRLENTFGSLFVDLSDADLSEIYEIRVECTFGSLELLLPEHVKVVSKEDNIFASCYVDQSEGNKEVYIKENCVFGSLKILKAKKK